MSGLKKSLLHLPGVGKQRLKELNKLGIKNIEDLLYFFPRRYEDRSQLKSLNSLQHGSIETILATVKKVEVVKPRRGLNILKVFLENSTGRIVAVWYNQAFLKKKLTPGKRLIITGKVDLRFAKQMIVNEYEFYDENDQQKHTARIIPIYPSTENLTQKFLRNLIFEVIDKYLFYLPEILPEQIREKLNLLFLVEAIKEMHFPTNWDLLKKARYRLVFDEFLILQLGIKNTKEIIKAQDGVSHDKNEELTRLFVEKLPFSLTKAQKRTILEIKRDMEKPVAMYRLVQGDVGAGKTVVAAYALLKAISGGYQTALMAPTEILAEQHYFSLAEMLNPLGIKPILLKGSLSKKEKDEKLEDIRNGSSKLIVGTHALIQTEVIFNNLGLAVIDEQHRFGVKQRLALQKKGFYPDLLVMTATPIPRSLALTLYGDMDLSIIDELPPGRQPIKTYHVNEKMRNRIYNFIYKEVKSRQQVYIVCPLVEESEKLAVENVTELATNLQNNVFPDLRVGLLHGRLPVLEKEKIMEEFRDGQIDILVATTVIEVGVNVPNANIIVIENAERFGLAQLHQLRGRVGRGSRQAYCILVSDPKTEEGKARMQIMTQSTDGFLIAEKDLQLRGPGEILGTKQHGLPDLKVADLLQDIKILEKSKKTAEKVLQEGLNKPEYKNLYAAVLNKFSNNMFKG